MSVLDGQFVTSGGEVLGLANHDVAFGVPAGSVFLVNTWAEHAASSIPQPTPEGTTA